MQKTYRYRVRMLSCTALFAALLAVCAWISVPAPVPFSMQSFAVLAAGLTLGGRWGAAAAGVYLALGAAGLPVFSGFGGGIGHLLGAGGGYAVGFVFCAGIAGALARGGGRMGDVLGCVLGLAACYGAGTLWYAIACAPGADLRQLLASCVLPFLLPDAVKAVLAVFCARVLRRHMPRKDVR